MAEDDDGTRSQGLSRRALMRLGGGAAAAVGLGSYLGLSAQPAAAVPFYRAHGPLLTYGYHTWLQAIANQGANLAKVVTTWGLDGGWAPNPDFVWTACGATEWLIVRTLTGDTGRYIYDHEAVAEIRSTRFYEFKAAQRGANRCIIELGNEPNAGGLDPWSYGWLLSVTIDRVRAEFPGALICGTALSPNKGASPGAATDPDAWYNNPNFQAAIRKCDFVGVHFYSNANDGNFRNQGSVNELNYFETFERTSRIWPGKPVIATEYSIRTTALSPYQKGYKYADLIHFDSRVGGNLWGATYYHVQTQRCDDKKKCPDPHEDVGSEGGRGYRARLAAGGL
jgi:hypothetical protein